MKQLNQTLLQGLDTIIVRVSNIEASKSWYEDKLGLTTTWYEPSMKLAVLDTQGSTSLTLWQTDQKIEINKNTASYPIFRTPDAAALNQELQNRGIKPDGIIQDDYVTYFFFFDPDGNVLEACQVHE
ncbi:MAG TPA: VOC family protein [Daejeonella sp.]|nr:VOC family protein [Daejeonella sp.]